MKSITFAVPLLPGKQESWRRWLQEVGEGFRSEAEAFGHALGMRKIEVWLTEMPSEAVVVVQIEAEEVEPLLANLAASRAPFASFLRQHILALHGLDVMQPTRITTEPIFVCQVS
jgi:hypothetical protein